MAELRSNLTRPPGASPRSTSDPARSGDGISVTTCSSNNRPTGYRCRVCRVQACIPTSLRCSRSNPPRNTKQQLRQFPMFCHPDRQEPVKKTKKEKGGLFIHLMLQHAEVLQLQILWPPACGQLECSGSVPQGYLWPTSRIIRVHATRIFVTYISLQCQSNEQICDWHQK